MVSSAHYRGDRRNFDEKHLVGPDFGNGFLKPVDADYDPITDMTTIRFEHLRRELWSPEARIVAMQAIQKRQVMQLAKARMGFRKAINDIVWEGKNGPPKRTTKTEDNEKERGVVDDSRKDSNSGTSHQRGRFRKHR
jgi:hypothetical protein